MRFWAGLFGTALAMSYCPSLLAAAPATGPIYDSENINYKPGPTERRGGFAMALTTGYGVGVHRGYELSVDALNDPNGKQSTGVTATSNMSLWFGGAIRDWITTGVGISLTSAPFSDPFGGGGALIFHIEGFPLYSFGGQFRNLGLGLTGGIGTAVLLDQDDRKGDPLAESGALSTLHLTAFWEPWTPWHFSMGPALVYTRGFSQTMSVDQVTLNFRAAIYGVQPKAKPKETARGFTPREDL